MPLSRYHEFIGSKGFRDQIRQLMLIVWFLKFCVACHFIAGTFLRSLLLLWLYFLCGIYTSCHILQNPSNAPVPMFIEFPCAKDSTWPQRFPGKSNCVIMCLADNKLLEKWESKCPPTPQTHRNQHPHQPNHTTSIFPVRNWASFHPSYCLFLPPPLDTHTYHSVTHTQYKLSFSTSSLFLHLSILNLTVTILSGNRPQGNCGISYDTEKDLFAQVICSFTYHPTHVSISLFLWQQILASVSDVLLLYLCFCSAYLKMACTNTTLRQKALWTSQQLEGITVFRPVF